MHSGTAGLWQDFQGGQGIAELLDAGKRVGISSNSYDAICELMKSAAEAATKLGIHFTAAKCGEEDRVPFHPVIEIIPENAAAFQRKTLPDLVGGSAWVFSRPEAQGQFDYLFIDEAGQVSLAKLVGMAPFASNLIFLGDQMQLSQPIRGSGQFWPRLGGRDGFGNRGSGLESRKLYLSGRSAAW